MTKATIDIAKAGKTPAGIMDITKIPDIALWSKQVTTGSVTKDGMPVTQGTVSIEKSPSAIDDLHTTDISKRTDIDPANPQEMSSVINSDLSLTDKTKPFSTTLDKLSSGRSKVRTSDKNKIIKFHGTEVKNVIIHYTISKGRPKNVVNKEFDASKIKLQFETINVQVVADYITITFYKDEHSNLILQREMIPAHRVEYIWVKDS